MSTPKKFYKKRLVAEEDGLIVVTDSLISIHETRCFHFCMPEREVSNYRLLKRRDESLLDYAKRRKMLKRIDKQGSRIAFETEEKALDHLRFLKRKQLRHMERDKAFIETLLATENIDPCAQMFTIPDSRDLVHQHFVFD